MLIRCRSFLMASVVPVVVFGSLVGGVYADDVTAEGKPTASTRLMVRDQRPDTSRGWVLLSKASYWPLCFEALDRIQEANQLIGSDDQGKAADTFEKCAAWLNLAASAAMTDGTAGVTEAAALFQDAADDMRDGAAWSDAELTDLTTLGMLVMAKSHVLRAEAPDLEFKTGVASKGKASTSTNAEVKASEKEIAKERVAFALAQYQYDAIESQRHLNVARDYLVEAGKLGHFALVPEIDSSVPDLTGTTAAEMADYVSDEVRPRIAALKTFIAEKRKELREKLGDRL